MADASNNATFDDFEKWEDERFWPSVMRAFGGEGRIDADSVPALDLAISTSHDIRSHPSANDLQETVVVKRETIARSENYGGVKEHIELKLPEGLHYRAGDYLAILPKNPLQNIKRVIRRFKLPSDATIYIKSNDTFLPHGTPLRVRDVLGSYVELS